jgi:hypothetical protein
MRFFIRKLRQARFGTKITTSIVVILLLLGIGLSIMMHQLVLRPCFRRAKYAVLPK